MMMISLCLNANLLISLIPPNHLKFWTFTQLWYYSCLQNFIEDTMTLMSLLFELLLEHLLELVLSCPESGVGHLTLQYILIDGIIIINFFLHEMCSQSLNCLVIIF